MGKKNEILTPRVMELIGQLATVSDEYDRLSDEVLGGETADCEISTLVAIAIVHEIARLKESIEHLKNIAVRS